MIKSESESGERCCHGAFDEPGEPVHDLLRILVGNEAEVDFDQALRRHDRLGSLARIAAGKAIDVHIDAIGKA